MDFLKAALKIFELDEGRGPPGREGFPYLDTKGNWTIGRGHFIGKDLKNLHLSDKVIELLFAEDFARHEQDAALSIGVSTYASLNQPRQLALISLVYTMGFAKFQLWIDTIAAIKASNWEKVSDNILQSKWARDVDPRQRDGVGRDDRIAYMFRCGHFHPDYKIEGPHAI